MWDNETKEGVARKLGEAVSEVEVQTCKSNMTDDLWPLHPFGRLDLGYVGYCGHHNITIQDERRYKLAKKKDNRRKEKAARKARKRNRR